MVYITSKRGVNLIKEFEGYRAKAYKCPAGVWTIGYGTTKGVQPGMSVTSEQAESMLKSDLFEFEKAVNQLVTAPINQAQFDALVSLVYNIGVGNFKKSSVLRRLNQEDYEGAAEAFMMWDKARVDGELKPLPGLVRRRKAERELFSEA